MHANDQNVKKTYDEGINADWDECDFAGLEVAAADADEGAEGAAPEGTWEVVVEGTTEAVTGSGDLMGASLATEGTSCWLEEGLLASPPDSSGPSASKASSRAESFRLEIFTLAVPLTTSRNLK